MKIKGHKTGAFPSEGICVLRGQRVRRELKMAKRRAERWESDLQRAGEAKARRDWGPGDRGCVTVSSHPPKPGFVG